VREKRRNWALDQRYVRHNTEQESGTGLRGLARKAKLVALPSARDGAQIPRTRRPKCDAARSGKYSPLYSAPDRGDFLYILGRAVSAVSLSALREAIAATSADQIAAAALFTSCPILP